MEIKGKITHKLPPVSGVAKSSGNPWKKQDYVLETFDAYPKAVAFDFFGDRVDQYNLEIGDMVTVSFDLESREYQGKWYTNVRAWKAEKMTGEAQQQQQPMPPAAPAPYAPQAAPAAPVAPMDSFASSSEEGDDLPF